LVGQKLGQKACFLRKKIERKRDFQTTNAANCHKIKHVRLVAKKHQQFFVLKVSHSTKPKQAEHESGVLFALVYFFVETWGLKV